MIEAKDLRIGNYVMDRGGKVLRIDWMERDKVCQKMELHGQEVHPLTEHFEHLQPIPLTYELLEKLGFEAGEGMNEEGEISTTMNMWIDPDNDIDVYISEETGEVEITLYESIVDEEGQLGMRGSHELSFETMAVHELQNLFWAIKKQELKLK